MKFIMKNPFDIFIPLVFIQVYFSLYQTAENHQLLSEENYPRGPCQFGFGNFYSSNILARIKRFVWGLENA
jgi:hypothetical protein